MCWPTIPGRVVSGPVELIQVPLCDLTVLMMIPMLSVLFKWAFQARICEIIFLCTLLEALLIKFMLNKKNIIKKL